MSKTKNPDWLADAVFYEIYPQSFCDSNADGMGDLQGILSRLDYIRDLGCNAVWINPCFASPFQDAGYDVADYTRIAPRYGTNADMERLCAAARKKGIRILLDLVPGHTSVRHPWFRESCRPEKNRYSDWYIWTDSPWTWAWKDLKIINGFADRDGCYVTNFFYSQPALNYGFAKPDSGAKWQQPVTAPGPQAVRREISRIIRFWLDRGVSGFRVDMAGSLVKSDPGSVQTARFWKEIRSMLDRDYPEAVLISEWSDPAKAVCKAGFHADFMLHFGPYAQAANSLFRFGEENKNSFFSKQGKGDIRIFLDTYLNHLQTVKNKGFIGVISGNHDCTRIRKGRSLAELKTAFAMILTLPSLPFIYYGDEIGMNYLPLPSREGGYGRTGSRTPMQWTSGKNAGFSPADPKKLYLPVDPSPLRPCAEAQENRKDSLLETVRTLLRLRRTHPALGTRGSFEPLFAIKGSYPFAYARKLGKEDFIICLNPSGRTARIPPSARFNKIEPVFVKGVRKTSSGLLCDPVSFGIFRKK